MKKILAGTGHRPDKLGGYSDLVQRELQLFAESQLAKLKPDTVLVGMALGWDQALGWAARARRIPFWAYIPFNGQESKWPPYARQQYRDLLSYAEKIVLCDPDGYAAWKLQRRNEQMVRDCTDVLALWNGSPGGTANCVAYARKLERPIHNCWKEWATR